MSLINDALRRARQEHPTGTSQAATPSPRPVDHAPRFGHRPLITAPFMGAVLLLLAGILLWGWANAGKIDIKVRANTPAPAGDVTTVPDPPVTPPLPRPVTVAAAAPALIADQLSTNASATPMEAPANGTNAVEVPRPEPPTYKLQGIFYKRGNPSASINGRTVFVGSKIGDIKVTAITQESVTIVTGAGDTKELQIGD